MLDLVPENKMNANIVTLLRHAKYVEQKLLNPQDILHVQTASSNQLTVNGFQFVLMDSASQAQHLLLNYIQMLAEANTVVDLIQFIFTLSLTEAGAIYKLKKEGAWEDLVINL